MDGRARIIIVPALSRIQTKEFSPMTKKLIILSIALMALVFAGAASYTVKIFDPVVVNGTELKPGDYKLTLDNDKAILQLGKQKIEAAVKVEQATEKFSSTTLRFAPENGKNKIQEIRLGGTKTKVIFN